MDVSRRQIPFFREKFELKLVLDERGRAVSIDADGLMAGLRELVRRLNEQQRDVANAVNSNEASAIIVQASRGLPTAGKYWLGRLVHIAEEGAADDALYWCRQNSSGNYEWKQIDLV